MQIEISRNKGWYGRARALKVVVDSKVLAKIKAGETMTIVIPNGSSLIWGQMDWGLTNKIDLSTVVANASLHFRARFSFNLIRSLGITEIPIELEKSAD